jgi:hypothetical protein
MMDVQIALLFLGTKLSVVNVQVRGTTPCAISLFADTQQDSG